MSEAEKNPQTAQGETPQGGQASGGNTAPQTQDTQTAQNTQTTQDSQSSQGEQATKETAAAPRGKNGTLRELMVYVICGGLTTAVSFAVQFLLGRVIPGERFLELRTAGSWVAAVAFAFVVNKLFVFRARSDGRGGLLAQIASFVGMRLISLGMEMAVISLGVRLCGDSAAVASLASTVRGLGFVTAWSDGDFAEMLFKLIGQVLVVISNYFFSKFVIFRKKK